MLRGVVLQHTLWKQGLVCKRGRKVLSTGIRCTRACSNMHGPRVHFAGSTEAELRAWLQQYSVPVDLYGTNTYKTISHLLTEVKLGESVLSLRQQQHQEQQQQQHYPWAGVAAASVLRKVQVLNLYIRDGSTGKVLMEAQQVMPGGQVRVRGVPLAEKMLPGEDWRTAAVRGVAEELGSVLPDGWQQQLQLLEDTYHQEVEVSESRSYPGLLTEFTMHRVAAVLPCLPTSSSFQTQEQRPEGLLVTTWEWRPV